MNTSEKSEMYEGFVIGCDIVGRKKKSVWKVRVTSEGPFSGKKFEVAEGTNHILLSKGMCVQFATAEFLVGKDRRVRKAVEVQLLK